MILLSDFNMYVFEFKKNRIIIRVLIDILVHFSASLPGCSDGHLGDAATIINFFISYTIDIHWVIIITIIIYGVQIKIVNILLICNSIY